MYGWVNASLKSTETREELSNNCNPKVMSRCMSAPDATSTTTLSDILNSYKEFDFIMMTKSGFLHEGRFTSLLLER